MISVTVGIVEQRLDRAEADDVGGELLEQALLLGAGQDEVFGLDDLVEEVLEALADLVDLGRIDRRVELGDQLALDALLQAALGFGRLGLDRGRAKRWFGWRDRRSCRSRHSAAAAGCGGRHGGAVFEPFE